MTVQLERRSSSVTTPVAPHRSPRPRWHLPRGAFLALLCALIAIPGAAVAVVTLGASSGSLGHDVSYPQCGTALPTTGTFGVVGVNGGRVSTTNPCLATQYAWASRLSAGAALYVNTGNPGSISTFYWPQNGARDPALCTDRTSAADAGCAYDYGWHGAENSMAIARNALGSGVTARDWWLDVELANSWNGTPSANAAALQGAVDRLRELGAATVGIYSTTYQWGQITGGYTSANAASYRSSWARAFTPKHPMETAPLWIAGLGTREQAVANCSASFTGAKATLAQYTDADANGLDGDVVCGGTTAPPTTTPTTPAPTTTTTPGGTTTGTASPTTTAPTTTAPTTTAPTTTTPATTTTSPATVVVPPPVTTTTTKPPSTTTTPPATTTTRPTTTTTTPRPTTTTPAPVGAPGVPRAVVARTHPVRGVALSWTAPATTGGAPVTRYAILRGTSPTRLVVLGSLTCTTPTCAWQDTAITGGRTAYYQVVAINTANRPGPASPVVGARGR